VLGPGPKKMGLESQGTRGRNERKESPPIQSKSAIKKVGEGESEKGWALAGLGP